MKQVIMRCPKCKETGGGDWSQCGGKCPVPPSPHYDVATHKQHGPLERVE